jgi:diguanylate cyclase (GGDEF)-like protein
VGLRITLLAFLPLLAVAAASVVVFATQTRPAVVAEYEQELKQALEIKSYATETWVIQQLELISWIGRNDGTFDLVPERLAKQSLTLQESFSQFTAVVYVDHNGIVIMDSAGRSGGYVGDREYFQTAKAGEATVSVLRSGRTTTETLLVVAAPIVTDAANTVGVVFGAVSTKALESVLAGARIGNRMTIQLSDQNGQVITSLVPDGEEFRGILTEPGGGDDGGTVLFRDRQSIRQMYAMREIPLTGWKLEAETPVLSITRVVRSYNRALLVTLGLMVLMVTAVAAVVIYSLRRPLDQLSKMSRKISDGNYADASKLSVSRNAPIELRRLSRTVQDMALLVGTRQRTLEHESLTDPLTGIANRRRLEAEGEALITGCCIAGHQYSVLMADLDRFKRINDEYGHSAGDIVLSEVAALMRAELRSGDLLARYGGEEFAAVLPRISVDRAQAIAERIRNSIESHRFATEHGELAITISIGVADATRAGCSESEDNPLRASLAAADAQLYQAKQNGRNCVCFDRGI